MKLFFLVLARDGQMVNEKIKELEAFQTPYLIVCGEKFNHPNVVYRAPHGKYDSINFGMLFVPRDVDVIALNDVDTKIYNFEYAVDVLKNDNNVSLVFVKVCVKRGPQVTFYSLLDRLRKKIPIAASGELMLIRYNSFRKILPIKGCKAEDSYILFKILEMREKAAFCESCYVVTERTKFAEQEEAYKRRTAGGTSAISLLAASTTG